MLRRSIPLLAVILLAAGCGEDTPVQSGNGPQAPGTIEINGEAATDRGTYSVTDFEKVAVNTGNFYFEPTHVTGPPGLEIELDFVTDSDPTQHNVTLPEQGIDEEIPPDSIVGVFASFPESGTLVFFCKYHRGQGMVGGLTAS
jgi:plastocyanin